MGGSVFGGFVVAGSVVGTTVEDGYVVPGSDVVESEFKVQNT